MLDDASSPVSLFRAKAVLFDFDGTLFDASEAIIQSFNAALREAGIGEWDSDRVRALIGRPLKDMFPLALPGADAAQVDRMIETYRAVFLPLSVPLTRELPGLRECLLALRREDYRLAIVTNRGRHGARHILEGFGLADLFAEIVGIDDVAKGKPDPEPVILALRRLAVAPERAVLVGDTRDDIRAADAAGVRGIGVATGAESFDSLLRSGASAVVPDLRHLPPLLRRFFPDS